ncbi:hypothetical protein CEP52_017487 [Fusarium oligoseptatum]|uniref:Uncharacterized protein n=1 Tax=Fusarium oligoseptatum TaxID=2604345 RepID=A0A428RQA6_9HYPO|nr:hypothetical protein CEP52_017487 [Fusarium oligoseptatum]
MPTILKVLTRSNVSVNSDSVIPSVNTTVRTDIQPEDWVPWHDFNYSTRTRIFHTELRKEYRGGNERRPLEKELIINNEKTLETLLLKFLSPIVNYALDDQAGQTYPGEGSRCSDDADWSAVSDELFDEHGYFNLLPGDTKLDAKWRPTMLRDNFNEWQKAVSQVETYMARNSTRYGFILTETNLVVLRLTRQLLDAGVALLRPQRATATSLAHQRHSSDVSMASTGISSSAYSDNNPEHWAFFNPEYAVIDWAASGQGNLTIKLALWALAMMATNGDRHIDYSCPDLDTWRWADGHYVHNSSGATKPSLSKRDVYQKAFSVGGNSEVNIPGCIETTSEPQWIDDPQNQFAGESAAGTGQSRSHHGNIPIHRHDGTSIDNRTQDQPHVHDPMSQFTVSDSGPAYDHLNEEDDDTRTEVGSSHHRRRGKRSRTGVTIHVHEKGGGFHYKNAKGGKIDTEKREWRRVEDGYELEGRSHVYYTKKFPG